MDGHEARSVRRLMSFDRNGNLRHSNDVCMQNLNRAYCGGSKES